MKKLLVTGFILLALTGCGKEIDISQKQVRNGIITEIEFCGGCDGNTHGLQNLILGMNKDEVIKKL
ncbi:TSCPD domain-containing protein, partial [Fusobacterium mortiferum]|uniref:TSCPD domain-containing protein n=1 Tax=Fusobacterium mortiferum TaxID=850 RepID=UPI001EF4CC8F